MFYSVQCSCDANVDISMQSNDNVKMEIGLVFFRMIHYTNDQIRTLLANSAIDDLYKVFLTWYRCYHHMAFVAVLRQIAIADTNFFSRHFKVVLLKYSQMSV